MKTILRGAALVSLAVAGDPSPAQPAAAHEPTVVLVHGAFGDAEAWDKVINLLHKQGIKVISTSIPMTSLADDVAATNRAIDRAIGPVVLVGHSWGGTVITEAGTNNHVRSLVFVAAFANRPGVAARDMGKGFPPAPGLSVLQVDAQGYATMPEVGFARYFAPLATPAERKLMYSVQVPINTKAFGEPVTHAAWQSKPSWFALTLQDQMIVPAQQEAMAKDIGAHVTRIASDHAAMVSHPTEVAKVIEDAVRAGG